MNDTEPFQSQTEPFQNPTEDYQTDRYQTDLSGEQRELLVLIVARHAAALPAPERDALALALDEFASDAAFAQYVRGWSEGQPVGGEATPGGATAAAGEKRGVSSGGDLE